MAETTDTIRASRIVGAAGTGKTARLIEQVCDLIDAGAGAHGILALCASPQAARAFSSRLAQRAAERGLDADAAAKVAVTTPRALALGVLGDAEAVRWSGREARMLTAYEELFLLEDMKVSGLRPKRLREMLKFFYRSWTEMADDDENWLLAGEETDVHTLLKANLAFVRSYVEPEIAGTAVRYLRTHSGARAAHGFAHVLADDFQLMSRASQTLADLVATESVTIAGDRAACVTVFDSYPYVAGLDEFVDAHPDAHDEELTACHRCAASTHAVANLLADEAMPSIAFEAAANAPAGALACIDATDPAHEFASVADAVARTIDAGTPGARICVAVPNGTWAANIGRALDAHGIAHASLPDRQPVRGDIRDNERCVPARVLTALDLVADPNSALAWRCWCGYGDYLANSAAIANLRAFADERTIGLVDALRAVAAGAQATGSGEREHVVGAQRVADAYARGCALIEQVAGLAGSALLDTLTGIVTDGAETEAPAVVRTLCLAGDADEAAASASPAAMAGRARRMLLAPTLVDENAVALVPYDLMAGLSPDALFVTGFVNGFIPCRDYFDASCMPLDKQEKEHAKDVRRVYLLTSKADRALTVSHFASTDLVAAGKLKLSIGRIRLVNGVRTCLIPPSDFLEQIR